jgi:hypothetical protein
VLVCRVAEPTTRHRLPLLLRHVTHDAIRARPCSQPRR